MEAAEALAQRVLPGQRLEFCDQLAVPSQVKVCLDALLDRHYAQFVEPRDLCREGVVGVDIGIRHAPP